MSRSATFTVTFTAARGSEAISALRGTLKLALRRFGLRAVDVREHTTAKVSHCRTAQAVRTTQARRIGEAEMDMSQYSGAAFLKVGDVKVNGPLRVVIDDIATRQIRKAGCELHRRHQAVAQRDQQQDSVPSLRDGKRATGSARRSNCQLGEIDFEGEPQESRLSEADLAADRKEAAEAQARRRHGG